MFYDIKQRIVILIVATNPGIFIGRIAKTDVKNMQISYS